MKHQQVVVDYWSMVKTSCICLLLALSGYILLKMVQTIFWLPGYLQNNQKRLEELAAQYKVDLEKEAESGDALDNQEDEAQVPDDRKAAKAQEAENKEEQNKEPKKVK